MGDKKPKKNSSGNADKHKAKQTQDGANRAPIPPKGVEKKKDGK